MPGQVPPRPYGADARVRHHVYEYTNLVYLADALADPVELLELLDLEVPSQYIPLDITLSGGAPACGDGAF